MLLLRGFGRASAVLGWLGAAFGPVAMLLALAKNAVMPALVAAFCHLLGVKGLPMVVMVVAASMPIGANVFMFSQRYAVGQEVVTAAVGLSSLLSMVTLSLVMAWLG